MLERLIRETVRASPLMKYKLAKVCQHFKSVVDDLGYPQIYINPSMMAEAEVPRRISVNRLVNTFGIGSGLVKK
jgi:hypothetical protein